MRGHDNEPAACDAFALLLFIHVDMVVTNNFHDLHTFLPRRSIRILGMV